MGFSSGFKGLSQFPFRLDYGRSPHAYETRGCKYS